MRRLSVVYSAVIRLCALRANFYLLISFYMKSCSVSDKNEKILFTVLRKLLNKSWPNDITQIDLPWNSDAVKDKLLLDLGREIIDVVCEISGIHLDFRTIFLKINAIWEEFSQLRNSLHKTTLLQVENLPERRKNDTNSPKQFNISMIKYITAKDKTFA